MDTELANHVVCLFTVYVLAFAGIQLSSLSWRRMARLRWPAWLVTRWYGLYTCE